MTRPIRLALVNDHPLVVAGLRAMFTEQDRIEVAELDTKVETLAPVDIALVDHFGQAERLPDFIGDKLRDRGINKVVVYTWTTDKELVDDALSAGASGVLSKSLNSQELVDALHRIVDEDAVVVEGESSDGDVAPTPRTKGRDWPGREHGLSAREAEMITLICQGLSNQDICARLYLSPNSVKTYIRSAYAKIGVQTRSQAVIWGVDHGMRPTPSRSHG